MNIRSPAFDGRLVADMERRFLEEMAETAVVSLRIRFGVVVSPRRDPRDVMANSNLDQHGMSRMISRAKLDL